MVWETPEEIDMALAKRLRAIRKRKGYTQKRLAEQCGVSYGALKLFEQTGNISLRALTKIAMVLGVEEELRAIFSQMPYRSLDEVRNERRQRA